MLSSRGGLLNICNSFNAPIKYCFGYGSGVLSQGSASDAKRRQVDIIFGVENPKEWHAQNIDQNPHHYSGLRYLGSSVVAWTQQSLGAGVYFNPFVRIDNKEVKYGVVDLETLKEDLTEWRTLYLAGRMHKPVKVVIDNAEISKAQQQNLRSAMSTALLLLPDEFSELDLYTKIAAVSYMGDVRMAFAENPRKVQNIVNNQFTEFRRLYSPLFDELSVKTSSGAPLLDVENTAKVGPESRGWALEQAANNEESLLDHLPTRFRGLISKGGSRNVRQMYVSQAVARIIKYPSFTQSVKGVLTAGVTRSFEYMAAKVGKRFSN